MPYAYVCVNLFEGKMESRPRTPAAGAMQNMWAARPVFGHALHSYQQRFPISRIFWICDLMDTCYKDKITVLPVLTERVLT